MIKKIIVGMLLIGSVTFSQQVIIKTAKRNDKKVVIECKDNEIVQRFYINDILVKTSKYLIMK
jgi:hypothetical protein